MTPSFRALTAMDEPFLWTALYHAIHVKNGDPTPPRDIIKQPALAMYVEQWMMHEGDQGILATKDNQPIGAAWLRLWQPPRCGFGFIDIHTPELSIALLPEFRGQGVGTALLNRLFATAKHKHNAICLSVSTHNPAHKLYQRLGFKQHGQAQDGSIKMRLSPIP